jgi:hypothetical protein
MSATLPAAATAGLKPTKATGYRPQLGLQALPATATTARELDGPPAGVVRLAAPPSGPVLENSFVSSVGWGKPGERYPFTLRVLRCRCRGWIRRSGRRLAVRPRLAAVRGQGTEGGWVASPDGREPLRFSVGIRP